MSRYLLLLICLACYLSWTQGNLTQLYNSRVKQAERWQRPLDSRVSAWAAAKLGYRHSGVVVTLQNNQRWLVHKGSEYGVARGTVVTAASNMGSGWTRTAIKRVVRSTVGDYVAAGGANYNLLYDNCHHASRRMMALP